MTSKKLLLELITRQKKLAYLSGDFDKLEPETEIDDDDGGITIVLDAVEIGFSFDKNGRFLGIFNWKE